MVWLSKDFESERKFKLGLAKRIAIRASKGMVDQATRGIGTSDAGFITKNTTKMHHYKNRSLLYAAGLRPTPAQATTVSWILKDGMQHMGKLICSNLGALMDSEPTQLRILAEVLYDLGTGLEIFSLLCPQLFLQTAGLGNFAKGMAVVVARATRLLIYSSFTKEGNLSELFAKGKAISTVFNVLGLGARIQLVSTVSS